MVRPHRVRQVLGEALTAEDDAAVLQELEELEGKEAQAEASELPSVPQVPCLPIPCPQRVPLPPLFALHEAHLLSAELASQGL